MYCVGQGNPTRGPEYMYVIFFMNWSLSFSLSIHRYPFIFRDRCSHMRLEPNFLELANEIWSKPSSLSFLFSVIYKGYGEAARMCCLA